MSNLNLMSTKARATIGLAAASCLMSGTSFAQLWVPDPTFNQTGQVTVGQPSQDTVITALAESPDGSVTVASTSGLAPAAGMSPQFNISRLLATGVVDPGFTLDQTLDHDVPVPAARAVQLVAPAPDGSFYLGRSIGFGPSGYSMINRLLATGALDPNFGDRGYLILGNEATALKVDPQGNLLVLVRVTDAENGTTHVALQRYLGDATTDGDFGGSGTVDLPGMDAADAALAVDESGRVVVAAREGFGALSAEFARSLVIKRFAANGAPDASFGAHGSFRWADGAHALFTHGVAASHGHIWLLTLATGAPSELMPERLLQLDDAGTLDASFGAGGVALAYYGVPSPAGQIMPLADGTVLVAGSHQANVGDQPSAAFALLADDGEVESLVEFSEPYAAALAPAAGGLMMAMTRVEAPSIIDKLLPYNLKAH